MRSKDRLPEFMRLASSAAAAPAAERVYCDTVEPAHAHHHTHPDIQLIFDEVERMRSWIHELNANTQLMRRLHADPTFHTNKHLQDQLDSAISASNAVGAKVCAALREFERLATGTSGARNDVRARIARLQYAATRALYADALADHQNLLHALRDDQLSLLHRQIQLTNLTISDEECQSLLDSKNISLFVDNVRAETAEARRALRDVEARREELARVEQALQELRDMFLQLAHLVAAQQEQIDSVEYFALQAADDVECGGHELLKGTVSRKRANKKKMHLILCLVCGFTIVLLVLILT